MKYYARVNAENVVIETLSLPNDVGLDSIYHPDLLPEFVTAPKSVSAGWRLNGDTFVEPELGEAPPGPAKRHFSFLEFMDLFTEEEQLTLVEASMTLPPVKLWYDKALGAQYIDLDDPRTGPGLQALVDANLITAGRMAAVLAGKGPA